MIDEVRGSSYFSDPIAFELEDGDIRESIRPYIMGRIVDVERFICRYPCAPTADRITVTLDIKDSFLPWNDRTLTICFDHGRCHITQDVSQHRAELSIATLTTLLLGYKSAAKLFQMGRIISDEATAALLDSALLHEMPYISDYI